MASTPTRACVLLAAARVLQQMYRGVPLRETETLTATLRQDLQDPDADIESRVIARSELARLGTNRGQLQAATQDAERALALLREHHSDGVAAAYLLNTLGDTARIKGELDLATSHYAAAVGVLESLAGKVARVLARPLLNLGTMAVLRGELQSAEDTYLRALELARISFGDEGAASVLNNLGIVSVRRGDMRKAEHYYQSALDINTRAGAVLSANRNLFNLADIAYVRGDHDTNIALNRRLLASFESLNPQSLEVALVLSSLADSQFELGELAAARANYERAIVLFETLAPDSTDFAATLLGIGDVELAEGEHDAALARFERVVADRTKIAPFSASLAEGYQFVASAHLAKGDHAQARRALATAVRLQKQVAAGTAALAQSHFLQARLEVAAGNSPAALQAYERAIVALEEQTEQLGGADDSRAKFAQRYEAYFKEYIRALLVEQQTAKAFDVLERYRARSLLTMLTEREGDLDFALTPELARARREGERHISDLKSQIAGARRVRRQCAGADAVARCAGGSAHQARWPDGAAAPRAAGIFQSALPVGADAAGRAWDARCADHAALLQRGRGRR